jgi:hypothetical protein
MSGGGCQGKITHIYGMLGTGFDFIMCPNMCLNVPLTCVLMSSLLQLKAMWPWSPNLYSLNLVSSAFFLFPVMKIQLHGQQFKGIVEKDAL